MKIYGGLYLENLIAQNSYFNQQAELFDKGVIAGIQLRVAHPSFTPTLEAGSFLEIPKSLPSGMEVFIHVGAENVGVDFGENLDECGVYVQHNLLSGIRWSDWNRQTLAWAQMLATFFNLQQPWGVVHLGYGVNSADLTAYKNIFDSLKNMNRSSIVFENVPPVADRHLFKQITKSRVHWLRERYWGFGGTPEQMNKLLTDLGGDSSCLIDFTHLAVMVNQAQAGLLPGPANWKRLECIVEQYISLPHCNICHFSGVPPKEILMDSHDYFDAPIPDEIRSGLKQMEVICLEMPFRELKSEYLCNWIERFHNILI